MLVVNRGDGGLNVQFIVYLVKQLVVLGEIMVIVIDEAI